MSYQTIIYDKEVPVSTITLNRPEKLNAINDLMFREIELALDDADSDNEIRYVIIKGAGRCFSVGQDLSGEGTSEIMPPDPRTKTPLTPIFKQDTKLMERWQNIFSHSMLMIAQVHGYCLGMGCDLTMMCRTVIASEDAIFGDPSVRMGYATANPLWTWKVGPKKAKELIFTGKHIDASEAYEIGLINLVVPRDRLDEEVDLAIESIDLGAGGIAGADGMAGFVAFGGAAYNLAGLGAAWGFASGLHAISAIQRRGFAPGEFNFWEARDRVGMKGAIEERDAPYEKLFPIRKGGKV